jgi:hypothetical protein
MEYCWGSLSWPGDDASEETDGGTEQNAEPITPRDHGGDLELICHSPEHRTGLCDSVHKVAKLPQALHWGSFRMQSLTEADWALDASLRQRLEDIEALRELFLIKTRIMRKLPHGLHTNGNESFNHLKMLFLDQDMETFPSQVMRLEATILQGPEPGRRQTDLRHR